MSNLYWVPVCVERNYRTVNCVIT